MNPSFIRYGIGVDLSKDHFDACIKALTVEENEAIIATRKFANTLKGCQDFHTWVQAKQLDQALVCRVLLEVTGIYHETLAYFLFQNDYYVSIELGKRTRKFIQSLGQDSKNDQQDCRGLASMALHRKVHRWQPAGKHLYKVRQILRLRKSLVTNKVSLQNQLRAAERAYHKCTEVINALKKMIKNMEAQITKLEKQAMALLKRDTEIFQRAWGIQQSLPGVGILTLMEIIAETDGFNLITSVKQLISYAGYDIIEKQSGKSAGKTCISKNGNARIRATMYMPALAHIRLKKGPLYDLYVRLIERNGGLKKKAQVAVQRKLLCLIYSLWKSGEEYDPEYHLKSQTENQQLHPQKNSSSEVPELHGIDTDKP
ncbi:MAG: IS110 family transposase [Bacteroidota bacterium]